MLASSSPPKVSRPRQGPRSIATTFTAFSVRTFAAAAPDAPAPMMQTSACGGFDLAATIGLQILRFLALGEPGQHAIAAVEDLKQRGGAGKADYPPADALFIPAVDRV